MLTPVIFKDIARKIIKPFVVVGRAFQDMFIVVKANIVRQIVHKRVFIGGVDGASWTSCSACVSPTTPFIVDVETGLSDTTDDQFLPSDWVSRNDDDSTLASPIPAPQMPISEVLEEVAEKESIDSPVHQCTAGSDNLTGDMFKTSTENARVVHARAKRHSILFGDDRKPGLVESITLPINSSLSAPNVFAQSEFQQKRILYTRAIRHEKLFGNLKVVLSKSEGTDLTLVAATFHNVTLGEGEGAVAQSEVVMAVADHTHESELDLGFLTADSFEDLPTPPSTPSSTSRSRARIVKSDSYGGSINYSLRRFSRNTQDFEDVMRNLKAAS